MVARIEKLTEEQISAMPAFADACIAAALSVTPVSHEAFETAIAAAYEFVAHTPQRVLWARSPEEGTQLVSMLVNQKLSSAFSAAKRSRATKFPAYCDSYAFSLVCDFHGVSVDTAKRFSGLPKAVPVVSESFLGGYFWAAWPAFERFLTQFCGLELTGDVPARADCYATLCANSGYFWVFDEVCVATEKHTAIHRDALHRLHNPTGPALSWADGSALYSLSGVTVPAEWVTAKSSVNPKLALTWTNVEQRRVLREHLGWSAVLAAVPTKVIQSDSDPEIGTLLECDLGREDDDGRPARFLRMQCGTGREFVERVGPTWGDTALAVQERRWGVSSGQYAPEERT